MLVRRPLVLLALTVAVALGACGRRGPLELPPGTAVPPPRAADVVDPRSQSNPTRPSLARDTSGLEAPTPADALAPRTTVIVPKTPFFLDPLL